MEERLGGGGDLLVEDAVDGGVAGGPVHLVIAGAIFAGTGLDFVADEIVGEGVVTAGVRGAETGGYFRSDLFLREGVVAGGD